jgi:N-acyl-D-aspartate/D-glutamate deacylase
MLDVVIRDGIIVDGSGAPGRAGDVGIRDGRVVALGDVDEPARRVIDADGRVVAPGFIDVHTHYDAQVFWDPTLSPSPLHGVTSVFGGNCGFTIAPLESSEADYLMRMLARVEGMPLATLEAGVPWDWTTTAEYLDRIDGTLSVNAGFLVGHSALRRVVMGPEGSERAATPEEIEAMAAMLRAGLAAGALGFSSTWSDSHNDAEGYPVPSRYAALEELVALSAVCGEFEGTSLEFNPQSLGPFTYDVGEAMIQMSVAAQRPLNWNVALISREKDVDVAKRRLALSDDARARGGKVVGLAMPQSTIPRFAFSHGFALDMLPGWAPEMARPPADKLRMLANPAERRRLEELAAQPSAVSYNANWGDRMIYETFMPDTKRYEGRIVGEIAAEEGKRPFDALLDIVVADGLKTTFGPQPPVITEADWAARLEVCRDPRAVVGASDAGAHLDFLTFFNYTTMFLQQAVREQQAMEIEEAVHLLTEVPAQLYGLRDRGVLAEGAFADVVVFDPDTVGSEPSAMRFDLPSGAGRLYADATGVDHVFVNGAEIVAGREFTDARPGTLVRSGRDTFTPSLD